METNFKKISELLLKSELSFEDQNNLLTAIFKVSDAELEPMLKLFSEKQAWIKTISENYKAKKLALANKNPEGWQKIIENEIRQIEISQTEH